MILARVSYLEHSIAFTSPPLPQTPLPIFAKLQYFDGLVHSGMVTFSLGFGLVIFTHERSRV